MTGSTLSGEWGIILFSYLLGSVPTGYWLGKLWKGVDVRKQGSGNLGATNVFRVLGTAPGIFTLLIDVLKGAAPVLFVKHLQPGAIDLAVAAGLAAIVGHTTSIFVRFRGGKGVATSGGVFAALLPRPSLISLAVFALCLTLTRRVSASSICAAIALAAAAFALSAEPVPAYAAAAVAGMVLWTHRQNIRRLLAGTEPRIGSKERPA
jgi:glycerol-3-phosphate acyltransferase PlsY